MQSNSISLTVTAGDVVYTRHSEFLNRSIYVSPDHALHARDTMGFYRTEPKPTADFYGVAKSSVKFSKDFTVDTPDGGTTRAPVIFEQSMSVPVGADTALVDAYFERMTALIGTDAVIQALRNKLEI